MASAVIIGLDIGSSSVRCTAYRQADLSVVASHSSQRRSVIAEGCIDDVVGLLDEIDALLETTVAELGDCAVVAAIGFSTFCMNLVGVDEDGIPVGNSATLSYAHQSSRVNEEVSLLKRQLSDDERALLYQRTGAPIHTSYALPQFRVLYKGNKDNCISRVTSWQTLASCCLGRWTGRNCLPISYSEASWCGLLHIASCQYDPRVLGLLPQSCRNALPPLVDYTGDSRDDGATVVLEWKKETIVESYATRFPALQGARLFFGLGDGACANIGSKCSSIERIACTVGTSAAARICLPLPLSDDANCWCPVQPGLFCYRINSSHVLVGGALTDGGSVVEWMAQLLNLSPVSSDAFQSCLAAASRLPLASSSTRSPTVVPFFSGERSTGFRTGATGAMVGLTRETKPEHFVRGCLEGVTLRIHAIVDRIRKAVRLTQVDSSSPIRIVCSGKALEENALWRQMLADCTGCEIVLDMSTKEGTSRGVAVLLRMALDGEDSFEVESLDTTLTLHPDRGTAEFWANATNAQERLLDCVSSIYE